MPPFLLWWKMITVLKDFNMLYDKNLVVLLDAGHTKKTPGKYSPKFPDGHRFYEWRFNKEVVCRIAEGLLAENIKFELVCPEIEREVSLAERVRRANAWCKKYGTKNCLFISVHSNAFGNGENWEKPEGWSIWTSRGNTKSDAVADIFWKEAEPILKEEGFKMRKELSDGDLDYESNFYVLKNTLCPAVLTENLFYTNKRECEFLETNKGMDIIADIHIRAIKQITAV